MVEGREASGVNGGAGQRAEHDAGAPTEAPVGGGTAQQLRTAFEDGREVVEDALGLGPDEADLANAPAEKPEGVPEDDAVGGTVGE